MTRLRAFVVAALLFGMTCFSIPAFAAPDNAMSPNVSVPAVADDSLSAKISLDLRDMDIIDVLKFLSLKGKFNLVVSKAISGRVTLIMKEVTVANALEIILKANNLAYYKFNNIVYVMTAEEYLSTYGKKYNDETEVQIFNLKYAKPSYVLAALDSLKSNLGKIVIDEDTGSVVLIDTKSNLAKMVATLKQMDEKTETKTCKLQYALAKDIAAQLKTRLDAKSVGSIQADDRSNQLIISALPERMKEVERLVKELDVPTKAVLIEVRILQILLNPKYDEGIDWSNPFGNSSNKRLLGANVKENFPISPTVSSVGTLSSFSYGKLTAEAFQIELKALKQVIDSKVIARPRLMVTNNEEANIHIGDTIPYVTSTTTGTGDTATVSETINFIDIGIKLKVTPVINDDGYVTMKIKPEISTRTKDVTTPKGAAIPQVNTTFVETNAIVKDGHTVVIGGLRQLTNKTSKQGLPYLMDVPVAGHLFKNQSNDLQDNEIAIFLTPYIVGKDHDSLTDPNAAGKKDIKDDKKYAHDGKNEDPVRKKEEEMARAWIKKGLR